MPINDHSGQTGPVSAGFAVTPSDATDFRTLAGVSTTVRAIYVGGAGNLAVTFVNGNVVTYTGIATGIFHPFTGVVKIMATNTTATLIIAEPE